jgi:hypothetical protein
MAALRALIITGPELAAIERLRDTAMAAPVDVTTLKARLATPHGKDKHMRQMKAQTVYIPMGYAATLSIEIGHPSGTVRHLSVSVDDETKLPSKESAWAIAECFGFTGSLEHCGVWVEPLSNGGGAVNIAQPLTAGDGGRA